MSRALRDPRVRILVAILVVALALLLSWHLVAPGVHAMAMMLGFCVAVVVVATALLFPWRPVIAVGSALLTGPLERPRGERVEPNGRHPPDEGVHLRH